MFTRLSFIITVFLLVTQGLQGAVIIVPPGAAPRRFTGFNYEVFSHRNTFNPRLIALNQALISYDHNVIFNRVFGAGAIPHLVHHALALAAPGPVAPYIIGLSLWHAGLWKHTNVAVPGPQLNDPEACQMVIDRAAIGIRIQFAHPGAIIATALGVALPGGVAPGYVHNALIRGGYLTPLASLIYRLRHNIPFPNCVGLAIPGGIVEAHAVVIHIHDSVRVSKNVKELSYNSLPDLPLFPVPGWGAAVAAAAMAAGIPVVGGMLAYATIKDMINAQFDFLVSPRPHSATIVSSDRLQPH